MSDIGKHPGTETFYVLTGRLDQMALDGVVHVEAGESMVGHEARTLIEVSRNGTSYLNALVIFVVDATHPVSTPAEMP